MRILITGVHGFVGGNLVKALKKDNEIYGLDIVAPEKVGVIKTYSWNELEKGVFRKWMPSSIWQGRRMIQKSVEGSGLF